MVAHQESGLVMLEAKKETLEQRIVRASAFRRPPKRWRHEQAGAKLASIESARSTASFAPRRTARGETMHQDSAGGGEDVGEGVAQEDRMPRNRPQLSGSAAFLRGGLSSSGCFRACRSCALTKSAPNKNGTSRCEKREATVTIRRTEEIYVTGRVQH